MIADVQRLLARRPFVPFYIVTKNGQRYQVASPEHAGFNPRGSRVHVWSEDGSKDFGLGMYMGQVPAEKAIERSKLTDTVLVKRLLAGKTVPELKLDSGETIYGFQCEWEVIGPPPEELH